MKKVGVIANSKRPHAADVFERLARKAVELNWSLFADETSAENLPSATVIGFEQFACTVDVLLAMGGDGTVLFCAKLLEGATVPILGINLGSLGFLTSVSEDNLEAALDALHSEHCTSAARMMARNSAARARTRRSASEAANPFTESVRPTAWFPKVLQAINPQ